MLLAGHYAMPVVNWSTPNAMDLREWFLLSGFFYLTLFPAFSRLPWVRQFKHKVSRDSCWSSKHSPGPTFCFNHSNPQKSYMWLVLLKVEAGQSRNINPHGELILPNISFEIFASYGIWTLFAIGEHVTSLLSEPLSHRALQIVVNYLEANLNLALS